ncbi:phage terminase small subunit [Sphingomonas naasensis]|uniref:Terminase small subunit n=1 Tax=Sphingomonas naasensis TaxID=1344951 RepID=A0A4S1WVW6_9SPHN|nr:terminase small subunit [Sphingomonas naasensis]NIJ18464.1 phage terminase small subunit [Sphingomonas naasensis]TGX45726.1 terminase small subunit [Sphingomonas naasensis]
MTPKQERFVDEYLIDLNATQAAIRAGYSERTAEDIGRQLLRKTPVALAISTARRERAERTRIDADWLLARLADETGADAAELYDAKGNIRPIREWPLIWRQGLVAGIETTTDAKGKVKVTKLRLVDRSRRLELIGRHVDVQAFKDRVEVNLSVDRAAELDAFLKA